MASDPWARFDSVLGKTKPAASPWDRFDAALPATAPKSTAPGPWEATASPLVQRRRLPDGSYETRPTPREGQEPVVTPAEKGGLLDVAMTAWGGLPERQAETAAGSAMPLQAIEAIGAGLKREIGSLADPATYRAGKGFREGAGAAWVSSPYRQPEAISRDVEAERQRLAAAAVAAGLPPALSATLDTQQLATTAILDPANLAGGDTALKGLRLARFGERAVAEDAARALEAPLARAAVGALPDEAAEEAAALARRRAGLVRLRPEDIERTLPETPAPRRLGAGIPNDQIEQRLGMRASPEDGEGLARLVPEEGASSAPRSFAETAPEARRLLGVVEDAGPWGRFDEAVARAAVHEPGGIPRSRQLWHGSEAEFDTLDPGAGPDRISWLTSSKRYAEDYGPAKRLPVNLGRTLNLGDLTFPEPGTAGRARPVGEWVQELQARGVPVELLDNEVAGVEVKLHDLLGGSGSDVDASGFTNLRAALDESPYDSLRVWEVGSRWRPEPSYGVWRIPRAAEGVPPPQVDLPSPSETPFRMSTKGIENSTRMQDDLRTVAAANRPEIAAARGPVVPVSQWHDAPALAEKLGLAPEDYLAMPPGRTFSPDEHALGRHYLGQMKKEALDLEKRIATGAVPDPVAAQAEKAARNRDVVRMMAKLQGQGSSEFGRGMRQLQEALDPYGLAETPRDRVRLALLKKYKDANASEAARLETAAIARLKREAARETRKAARQVTAEELSAELGQLAQEFREAARRPRALSTVVPLDPELVEVVGKMAVNRVRAGVVAVEELADQVYTAVARQVDGVTREQVKAAIVEHALAGKQGTPKLPPEEARLRRAEAASARSIKKLEERIAAGGALPGGPNSSPWSSKLADLKAKQAALREQLAALKPVAPARDSAVAKLRTREQALARQVEKAEERLAAGPSAPQAKAAPLDSPRLQDLRLQLDKVRAKLAADPKEGLRELLDDQTIEMIATLPDPAEDPTALLDFLRLMERPGWKDYAGAFVYNNLLSGPKSLLKNVVGNTVKRWDRVAMQPLSAGFERVLAPMQGRLPERYVREVLPMVVGSYHGAPEALQKGLWVLKHGWDPERVVGELTGVRGSAKYYEGRLPVDPFLLSQNRGVRAFGAIHGYGPRLMQVGDVMARARNFSSATYAWATRTAINDVKRGTAANIAARAAEILREQPDEMIEYAQRVAREDTFQDEVSGVAKLLGAGRREDTGVGFALNQTVRFLNVPDRIMAWIGDYTPGLRIAGAGWRGGKLRKAWGTAEASDILARQTFGTALAGAAAAWAFQGKLTGNMPRDEKLKNDAFEAGKQPNSALLGGYWIPIRDLFGGWAGPVVAAAAFHDAATTGESVDGEELLERAGGAALGEARFLLDAGYLSTLSDTVGAIQAEPEQAGREMAGLATRTAAGALIPWSGLQRNVAIFQDPRVVERDGPLDEVKAGIPGLRQTLPARIGTLGEELRQNTGSAGALLPIVPTRNQVADPGSAESIERMRATLTERRREVGRIEAGIKDALKAKNSARVQELRASLPFSIDPETGKPSRVTTARLDKVMESIRANEQRIRKLRASGQPEDVIRRGEIEIQKRMAARLEAVLAGIRSP